MQRLQDAESRSEELTQVKPPLSITVQSALYLISVDVTGLDDGYTPIASTNRDASGFSYLSKKS